MFMLIINTPLNLSYDNEFGKTTKILLAVVVKTKQDLTYEKSKCLRIGYILTNKSEYLIISMFTVRQFE